MTALKVFVAVLGLALVAGFTVLFLRMAEKGRKAAGAAAPLAVDATVPLPAGARVLQVSPDGPLVDVLVERPDGTWDLMQVRRADGTVAGTLRLTPARP